MNKDNIPIDFDYGASIRNRIAFSIITHFFDFRPCLYRITTLNLLFQNFYTATEAATTKQNVAAIKSAEITEQSKVIAVEKGEAEEALAAALPALEAARLALSDLDKNDITEIRSFATPPEAVQVSKKWAKATQRANQIKYCQFIQKAKVDNVW